MNWFGFTQAFTRLFTGLVKLVIVVFVVWFVLKTVWGALTREDYE